MNVLPLYLDTQIFCGHLFSTSSNYRKGMLLFILQSRTYKDGIPTHIPKPERFSSSSPYHKQLNKYAHVHQLDGCFSSICHAYLKGRIKFFTGIQVMGFFLLGYKGEAQTKVGFLQAHWHGWWFDKAYFDIPVWLHISEDHTQVVFWHYVYALEITTQKEFIRGLCKDGSKLSSKLHNNISWSMSSWDMLWYFIAWFM